MEPTAPPPNDNNDSTEQWFNDLPSANQPSISVAPTPIPPSSVSQGGSRKKWIIVAIGIAIIAIGATVAFFLVFRTAPPTTRVGSCLTNKDYAALTGVTPQESLSPKENFYTTSLEFTNQTADYTDVGQTSSSKSLASIGRFYTQHKDSSIMITVTGDYYEDTDTKEAALQRISKIRQSLQQAGVPASAVKTSAPASIVTGGELSEDSEELATARAYISIASDSRCQ